MADDFLTIARVAKTQGRRGEVACDLFTDFPEKFAERKRVYLWNPQKSAERREMQIEEHWDHKGRIVFKFAGVDSISDAEALVGYEVQIPESERAPLEEGAYYVSDLVGCEVFDGVQHVGEIVDVNTHAGGVPLLYVSQQGEAVADAQQIPFVESYIVTLDLAAKRLVLQLPEGLLDINRS
jgi:16S rRNA processing protein RimM